MVPILGGRQFNNTTVIIFDNEDEACFGNLVALAHDNGWEDTHGDASTGWTPTDADACEEDALWYLQSKGFWLFFVNEEGDLQEIVR